MTVRLLSELNEFEKLGLISMSYSRINQFYDWCEAKYYYQYIIKAESVSGPAALLGNVIHSVLEKQLEKGKAIQPALCDVLMKEYKTQLGEWDPESTITDKLIQEGVVMLEEFIDRHMGDIFSIEAKEQKIEIVIGPALITGYIDRIDIDGNRLSFTDYKSGKKEVAAKNVPQDLQLGIYALALKRMYPDKEIYGELYYLRTGRQKGHLFSDDDLNVIESRLVSAVYKIIEHVTFAPTTNERVCSMCDYAITGLCPVGSQRIRR